MSGINPKGMIMEARKLEVEGFLLESTRLYEEAIDLLSHMIDSTTNNESKEIYTRNLNGLRDYKDEVKQRVLPSSRRAFCIKIVEGSTGWSYERIFGEYLDDSIKEMHIIDSYIFDIDQIENLICFLELVVKKCKNLRYICLFTKKSVQQDNNQQNINMKIRQYAFKQMVLQLSARNIHFCYRLKRQAHDRRIELSNGTTFVLGFGLDIYQKMDKFSLGHFDYNLRKCKETYVEILQTQPAIINTENLI